MVKVRKNSINKICRPKSNKIFQRKRLFRILDESRKSPVIWISGPGGSGKTTLVTSYLEDQNLDCIWYQMDARDNDPATFIYYMNIAAKQAAPRKRKPLPIFTPECMLGPDKFALRYFEALFQYLPSPMVIVLDNFQIVPSQSILHQLILNGLTVIPGNTTVILISRENPPPAYAGLLANQKMTHIGWHQIQLDRDETAGIAQLQTEKPFSEETINHMHKAAGGWAAGLLLMLAQTDVDGIDWQRIHDFTPQEVFDYLGEEVFEREVPETQDFLLQVSLLPHMTIDMAKALTGNSQAGQILSELNRCNRFTEQRFKDRLSYQLHPLFREFLLRRCKRKYSQTTLDTLYRMAAALLRDEGDIEESAALLQNAEAWDQLIMLILNHAPTLLQYGRNQTLLEWLRSLPEEKISEMPWLEYWMGTALTSLYPEAARRLLESAYHSFRSLKDAAGLFLSWAGVVQAIFFEMKEVIAFDPWIKVIDDLMTEYREFPGKEIEGQVVVSMLIALQHRQMQHPHINAWIDRALLLLSGPLNFNMKVSLITSIVPYYLFIGDYNQAEKAMDLLGPGSFSAYMESQGPLATINLSSLMAFYYCNIGEHDKCMDIVSRGLEFSRKTGTPIFIPLILFYGIWSALIHEQYSTARALFEENAAAIAMAGPLQLGAVDFVRSLQALELKDLGQAETYAVSSLEYSLNAGVQFGIILSRLLNARIMHELERYEESANHLQEAGSLSELTRTNHFMFHAFMLDARFKLDRGFEEAGLLSLGKALALGKKIGLYHNVIDSRSNIARLCAVALEHDIEEGYVGEYIKKRSLIPDTPPVHLENWPWLVKIFTLGRFSIVKQGNPIRFQTKAQKKPMEMIKVIIALGGRNVNKEEVCDILWPDAEGDKADQAFATTLHRLRNLLDNDLAVQIQDGKLNLNPACCWVDCWSFERLLSKADETTAGSDPGKSIELIEKSLSLYKGAFLSGDESAPWSVSRRERLRSKFLLSVNRLTNELESKDQWENAVTYYQHSLDVEDLSEETYQRLMQCLQHLGRKSEAISVYKRCRATLHAALGLTPSADTQTIYQSLVDGE